MTIDAKILDINFVSAKLVELVIRKKKGDKYFPICFIGFSQIIDSINELGLQKTDKVRIGYSLISKKYTSKDGIARYSTSAIIENIDLLQKNATNQIQVVFVDSATGEILK